MAFDPPMEVVDTLDALVALGFSEVSTRSGMRELSCDLGNLKLSAKVEMDPYLRAHVLVSGSYVGSRSAFFVEVSLPERLESAQQAAAWISHSIPLDYFPIRQAEWLDLGRQSQHVLPWVRHTQAFNDRPQTRVSREWMRPAAKKLREAATSAAADERCRVWSDQGSLGFQIGGQTLSWPAESNRGWEVDVSARSLAALPVRWMNDPVLVAVWENNLVIENLKIPADVV